MTHPTMQFDFDGLFRTKEEWCHKLIEDILAHYATDAIVHDFETYLRTRTFYEDDGGHTWGVVMVQTQLFERCVGAYRKDQASGDFIYEIEMDDPTVIAWAFNLDPPRIMRLYGIPDDDIMLAQLAWPQDSQEP